jgi:hypothetical protein
MALRVIGARNPPLCDNVLAFDEVSDALSVILKEAVFKFYNNLEYQNCIS